MNNRTIIRRAALLFGVGVLGVSLYGAQLFYKKSAGTSPIQVRQIGSATTDPTITIGGDFSLTDTKGNRRHTTDWRGRYVLLYFGYSYCPDICPAALDNMSEALKRLGQHGKMIQPVFVTIDPDRDTKDQLKTYMASYHPTFIALSGPQEEIDIAVKKFKVVARKVKDDGSAIGPHETPGDDYLVDHSSIIYLMDKEGQFIGHFNHLTPPEVLSEALGQHLRNEKTTIKTKL